MQRFVKRDEISKGKSTTIRLISVALALILFSIVFLIMHKNPLDVYASMLKGAFGSPYAIRETIKLAIPLCIAALGIAVAFKMHFWNIGAEGQILMGAFAASIFALKLPDMPRPALLLLMMAAGIIGGSFWSLIPAVFKAKWGTNETIVTLMMNYIAIKWIVYLQHGPLKDPNAKGFAKIANFTNNAILPEIFKIHIGWILAIVLVIFIYIFMNYTKRGYEISVLGESEKTALYSGVNIKKTIIVSILLSGGLCGLVGMIQASGISNTLSESVSGGVGYTAIIVSWLGYLSAPIILIISILFAALEQGGSFIQTSFGIPSAAALTLQALILFFVLGSEFFIRFKFILKVGDAK
jgi:simple sugar transport system permease protein